MRKAVSEDWKEDFIFTFWKLKWQVKFNISKHELVYMGKMSPSIMYEELGLSLSLLLSKTINLEIMIDCCIV